MWNLLNRLLELLNLRQVGLGLSLTPPTLTGIGDRLFGNGGEMEPSPAWEFDEEKIQTITTSRDFRTGHPELISRLQSAIRVYEAEYPGRKVIATCVYRSPEEQRRLFAQGRFGNKGNIVTNCDGKDKKSKHNVFPSRAVDCAILDGGKAVWDETYFYPLANYAKKQGLLWGGDWVKFQDIPHFELPEDVG